MPTHNEHETGTWPNVWSIDQKLDGH
jgi:hypothetical protein